jgi:hypothetical protein
MFYRFLYILSFAILFTTSCKKDSKFLKNPGSLGFSKDTVYFDTVFTKLSGSQYPMSVNKRFMIRNPYSESVSVNVRVMGGSASVYRINVDGLTGRVINDVEIRPKDSAWVFVEASLEANNQTNPVLVRDSIEFETNGNRQYVQLAAYGWDAYYFKDSVFKGNTTLFLKDKPYVIVNSIFVDNGAILNIGPGLHFYSSTNSFLVDTDNKKFNISTINVLGTLNVNGTKSEPVVFEGDRLNPNFNDKSGQWRGIHFYRGSVNNTITHSIIKNGGIGVWVDSLPENNNPGLVIKNTEIKNMSAYGVLGLTAHINMENCVISNCGANTFIGYYGGIYNLNHCTFFSTSNGRRDPHFLLNNQMRNDKKEIIRTFDIAFKVINSIIWGPSLETEFWLDLNSNASLIKQSDVTYNIIKAKVPLGGTGNIYNTNPLFKDITRSDFSLTASSPAVGKANPSTSLSTDYNENPRDAQPDMGAFELQ